MKSKKIILAMAGLFIMATGPINLHRSQRPEEERRELQRIETSYASSRQEPQFISLRALSKPLTKLGLAARTCSLNEVQRAWEDVKPEIYLLIGQHLEKCDEFWQYFKAECSEWLYENRRTIGVGAASLSTGFVMGRLSIK